MNIHKCGEDVSYSIFGISLNENCTCDHSNNTHENECCKDKKITIKANSSDKILKKEFSLKKFELKDIVLSPIYIIQGETNLFSEYVSLIENEFPPCHSPPLFILYRVFRI